jgi:hypothetical protein
MRSGLTELSVVVDRGNAGGDIDSVAAAGADVVVDFGGAAMG